MRRILVTGASGGIGTRLRTLLKGVYPEIRWSDAKPLPDARNDEAFVKADLTDLVEVERAVDGVMASSISAASRSRGRGNVPQRQHHRLLQSLRSRPPQGRRARRVRLLQRRGRLLSAPAHIGVNAPVRPDSRYGVSKAFGEALAALYAYKHGLRVTSLRLGNVADAPIDKRRLSIWLDPRDLVQLIRIGLEHPDIRCEIFYGASDNDASWWDNSAAFSASATSAPVGKAEDHRAAAMAAEAKSAARPSRGMVRRRIFLQRRIRRRHRTRADVSGDRVGLARRSGLT